VDHLQESGASIHRRRRRRRAAITLTLVAILLLGTFGWAAAYFQGWVGSRVPKPLASPSCPAVTPVKALTPRAVTVNVYNATNREGLAASVAKLLRTQGFKVAAVENDPLRTPIAGVGEVRHGPAGAAAATLAAARLSGARIVLDKRTDATVDVVLGNTFRALSAPRKIVASKPAKNPAPPAKNPALNFSRPAPSPSRSC